MKFRKRIINILVALIYILAALMFETNPKSAASIIILIISFSYVLRGLGNIIYYITMARFAVGGRSVLYQGIILLDFGLFATLMANIPIKYGVIYLVCLQIFYGIVGVLRALEARKLSARHWRLKLVFSLVVIAFAISCCFNLNSYSLFVDLYSLSLISSGIELITRSFRKTAIVYIQ